MNKAKCETKTPSELFFGEKQKRGEMIHDAKKKVKMKYEVSKYNRIDMGISDDGTQ
jgi:hypothetical protein